MSQSLQQAAAAAPLSHRGCFMCLGNIWIYCPDILATLLWPLWPLTVVVNAPGQWTAISAWPCFSCLQVNVSSAVPPLVTVAAPVRLYVLETHKDYNDKTLLFSETVFESSKRNSGRLLISHPVAHHFDMWSNHRLWGTDVVYVTSPGGL